MFLFSPKSGVVCDRRTESCTNKRVANGNFGNSFNRTQARDGFGAIGSPSDRRTSSSNSSSNTGATTTRRYRASFMPSWLALNPSRS